jgi:hypothetical protein
MSAGGCYLFNRAVAFLFVMRPTAVDDRDAGGYNQLNNCSMMKRGVDVSR